MFRFEPDFDLGVVNIHDSGFSTPADGDAYVAAFDKNITLMRRQSGRVGILVDSRETAVHSAATIARLKNHDGNIDVTVDRMAVVVSTSLKKQQLTRTIPSCAMAFLSLDAANLAPGI